MHKATIFMAYLRNLYISIKILTTPFRVFPSCMKRQHQSSAFENHHKSFIIKFMKHKVKVTVIDKKLYPELQQQYCINPESGACPCYNVGDEFILYRDEERDDFWHMGLNTLVKTSGDPDSVAGGPKMPFCSEAWDAISRYIYAAIEGGSIMKSWMKEENTMIACCNDGTRPVIFRIERIDYE